MPTPYLCLFSMVVQAQVGGQIYIRCQELSLKVESGLHSLREKRAGLTQQRLLHHTLAFSDWAWALPLTGNEGHFLRARQEMGEAESTEEQHPHPPGPSHLLCLLPSERGQVLRPVELLQLDCVHMEPFFVGGHG